MIKRMRREINAHPCICPRLLLVNKLVSYGNQKLTSGVEKYTGKKNAHARCSNVRAHK